MNNVPKDLKKNGKQQNTPNSIVNKKRIHNSNSKQPTSRQIIIPLDNPSHNSTFTKKLSDNSPQKTRKFQNESTPTGDKISDNDINISLIPEPNNESTKSLQVPRLSNLQINDVNIDSPGRKTNSSYSPVKKQAFNLNMIPTNDLGGNTAQIKVVSRFRPLNSVEEELSKKNLGSLCVKFSSDESAIITNGSNTSTNFTLDRIFDIHTTQQELYDFVAKPTIADVLRGYNGTIFTYGQSGSGKTFSMYGTDLYDDQSKGIIPRAIQDIFEYINDENNKDVKFELKFSMLEIYKENLYDLLNPETKHTDIKIKEHPKKGIYVKNLTQEYITSEDEFLILIENADDYRVVSETGLNKSSSRSHLLFQLEIIQKCPDDTEKRGILNLVDLAGSEKISKTHAVGDTLEEAKKINLSLSTLGNVISALTSEGSSSFVPYRDSKLTRILQDSLGGNYKTTLIVTCSPHIYNSEETVTTLKFAQRAKKIKNKVKINIKRSVEQLEAIIEAMSKQLRLANDEIIRLKGNPVSMLSESTGIISLGESNPLYSEHLKSFYGDPLAMTGFSHPNDSKKELIGIDCNYYTNIIKNKDEEIIRLNEKIDDLNSDNKILQDKMIQMIRENNFDKILSELEIMTKNNIQDIKSLEFKNDNILLAHIKNENEKLRDNYALLENKYFSFLKELDSRYKFDEVELQESEINNNNNNEVSNRSVNLLTNSQFVYEEELKQKNIIFTEFYDKLNDSTNSKKNFDTKIVNTYRNIYNHSKLYLNSVLKDFIRKSDNFGLKYSLPSPPINISDSYKKDDINITINKQKYRNLKNSFTKMNMLMVYYEKIIFDLMNRSLIDIKRFEVESQIKIDIQNKCESFNKILITYLEVLVEVKSIKINKEKEDQLKFGTLNAGNNSIQREGSTLGLNSKDNISNLRQTTEDNTQKYKSTMFHSSTIIKENENENEENIIIDKKDSAEIQLKDNRLVSRLNFLKENQFIQPDTPKSNLVIDRALNFGDSLAPEETINGSNVWKKRLSNSNIVRHVNKTQTTRLMMNALVSRLAGFKPASSIINVQNEEPTIDYPEPHNTPLTKAVFEQSTPVPEKTEETQPFFTRGREKAFRNPWSILKGSIIDNTSRINVNVLKENNDNTQITAELKQARKELNLYKSAYDSISDELNDIKMNKKDLELIIYEYQENNKKIIKNEVDNFAHSLKIYKHFYEEEIVTKGNVIEELVKVIDDRCLKYK